MRAPSGFSLTIVTALVLSGVVNVLVLVVMHLLNHSLSASTGVACFRRNSFAHLYRRPKRPDARDVSSPPSTSTRHSSAAEDGRRRRPPAGRP
jgi:hypothetical protein